jgi:hypothetical protein
MVRQVKDDKESKILLVVSSTNTLLTRQNCDPFGVG